MAPQLNSPPGAPIAPAPPPVLSAWNRIAAGLRLPVALRAPEPPPDPALGVLYDETLAGDTLDAASRTRVCRALTYIGAAACQYVPDRIPFYIEAACAFPDDERCVLFMLALLHNGAFDPFAALPFAQGVYAAALYFLHWEHGTYRARFGLPPYQELRHTLAALYIADGEAFTPERTALVETVYQDIAGRHDTHAQDEIRLSLASYLSRAYWNEGRDDLFSQVVLNDLTKAGLVGQGDLAGASAAPRRRYDASADRSAPRNDADWDDTTDAVERARASIAAGQVDSDTRFLLKEAAARAPDDPLLELAYLYAAAQNGAAELVRGDDTESAARLEWVVYEKQDEFARLAAAQNWDWGLLERALALCWGQGGRTDQTARALYKRVAEENPSDRVLAILYARALAAAEIHTKAAIPAYERVMEMGKGGDPVRYALARSYAAASATLSAAQWAAATPLWEELYEAGMRADPQIAAALADAYRRGGASGEAREPNRAARQHAPPTPSRDPAPRKLSAGTPPADEEETMPTITDVEEARRLADGYLRRGDTEKAESVLRQAIALGGGDKQLFALLGEVLSRGREPRVETPARAAKAVSEPVASLPLKAISPPDTPPPSEPEVPHKPMRQTLLTQNTMPPPEPILPVETPASQNLTRSAGAAAIKAALRSRAARIAQSERDGRESSKE